MRVWHLSPSVHLADISSPLFLSLKTRVSLSRKPKNEGGAVIMSTMSSGKRQRAHMKRTTSFKQFSFDLNDLAFDETDSVVLNNTASFLRSCSLCKRKLVPCRDIYMYRGNSAFCSHECREQEMKHDEKKDKKCSYASSSKRAATSKNTSAQVPAKGNAVAAAV